MERRARALALLTSAFGLAGCVRLRAVPADPAAAVPPASDGVVDAGHGVQLFRRVVGTGRQTIVVLHGGPGFSMDYLEPDLRPLAQRYTMVFYDQRGSGRSSLVSGDALDAQRFVDDLEAVRRDLGLEQLTLLGHSWGGGLAALYALRHPDRVERMMIAGGIPLHRPGLARTFQGIDARRSEDERRRLRAAALAWRADPGSEDACRAFYDLWYVPFYADPAARARSLGRFCAGSAAARRNKIEGVDAVTMASLGDYDWRPGLRTLGAPVLVVHGDADPIPIDAAREWAATLPRARLLALPGAGHFSYVEAPARFFAAVDAFMAGRWPDGAIEVTADAGSTPR